MAAYIIVEIEIIDPVSYEEYKKQAAATVHQHGGKYIARGGKTEVLEGDWNPKRIVVLQFESMERGKEFLALAAIGKNENFPWQKMSMHFRQEGFCLIAVRHGESVLRRIDLSGDNDLVWFA